MPRNHQEFVDCAPQSEPDFMAAETEATISTEEPDTPRRRARREEKPAEELAPTGSPEGRRPSDPPALAEKPPPLISELEQQMAALMQGTDSLLAGTKQQTKDLQRAKRRSREISAELDETIETFQGASKVWAQLVGFDANMTEEELRKQFNEIDTDGSGAIDRTELRAALKLAKPKASDKQIEQLLNMADADNSGEIDFEEFKAIVKGEQMKKK